MVAFKQTHYPILTLYYIHCLSTLLLCLLIAHIDQNDDNKIIVMGNVCQPGKAGQFEKGTKKTKGKVASSMKVPGGQLQNDVLNVAEEILFADKVYPTNYEGAEPQEFIYNENYQNADKFVYDLDRKTILYKNYSKYQLVNKIKCPSYKHYYEFRIMNIEKDIHIGIEESIDTQFGGSSQKKAAIMYSLKTGNIYAGKELSNGHRIATKYDVVTVIVDFKNDNVHFLINGESQYKAEIAQNILEKSSNPQFYLFFDAENRDDGFQLLFIQTKSKEEVEQKKQIIKEEEVEESNPEENLDGINKGKFVFDESYKWANKFYYDESQKLISNKCGIKYQVPSKIACAKAKQYYKFLVNRIGYEINIGIEEKGGMNSDGDFSNESIVYYIKTGDIRIGADRSGGLKECKKNDRVTMIVDIECETIEFKVNGQSQGVIDIPQTIIEKKDNPEFYPFIQIWKEDDSIQIL